MMHLHTILILSLFAAAPAPAKAPANAMGRASAATSPESTPAPATPAVAGRIFLKVDEALELAFPGCDVERGTVYLTDEERKRAERLAGSELGSAIVHPYVARRDGQLVGTAFVDVHKVRTLRESLFVVVSPEGRVQRLEVLAFAEPLDYLPRGSWFGQFKGRQLDDELNLDRGIRGVTGATLSARATTSAVRRTLALHELLTAPPTGGVSQ